VFNSIPRSQLNDDAAARLVCLPYAGGGTASYHRWRPIMPADIDLLPLALPGHDGRLNEPLYTDLKVLAGALGEELGRHALDRPFVLLGHSMGALLAFEIARSLRRTGHDSPHLLVLTGCPAPHAIVVAEPLYKLPDDELMNVLQRRYGGIPAVVGANPELWSLLAPVIRADFEMIETYSFTQEPPLDVPMLVLGGTEDSAVSAGRLMEWRRHTTQDFNVRLLPGGHFFLFADETPARANNAANEDPTPAVRIIINQLRHSLSAKPVDKLE
jgi:surfactin synthase thioesterase subunit